MLMDGSYRAVEVGPPVLPPSSSVASPPRYFALSYLSLHRLVLQGQAQESRTRLPLHCCSYPTQELAARRRAEADLAAAREVAAAAEARAGPAELEVAALRVQLSEAVAARRTAEEQRDRSAREAAAARAAAAEMGMPRQWMRGDWAHLRLERVGGGVEPEECRGSATLPRRGLDGYFNEERRQVPAC